MEDNKVIVTVEMPIELRDRLKEKADDMEMSVSGLIRLSIKEYLNK